MRPVKWVKDFLQSHPWAAAALGFLNVYAVWFMPSIFVLHWEQWHSYAYMFGDPIILPLFTALSVWLLTKNRAKIPPWSIMAAVASGLFLTFFEPELLTARKNGEISLALAYHGAFEFLQFSFILFMLAMYPFLSKTYAPIKAVTPLYFLIGIFLFFAQFMDRNMHNFGVLENVAPSTLLVSGYIFLLLDRAFRITGKIKRWTTRI